MPSRFARVVVSVRRLVPAWAVAGWLLVALIAAAGSGASAVAQEAKGSVSNGPSDGGPATPTVETARGPELKAGDEKRLHALAGLLALVGIMIAGLALVVWIMLWARRLRRLNRRSTPAHTALNEFWMLQKKTLASRGETPPGDAGDKSGPASLER